MYGSPNSTVRRVLWRHLVGIAGNVSESWVVLGDFNAYLAPLEKVGGASPSSTSMKAFRDCLDSCGLSDLGFKGPPFTWERRG